MDTAVLIKMRLPVVQQIAAGIIDDRIEIFYNGVDVYAISGARCLAFKDWDERLLAMVESDMNKYPLAIAALIDLGIEDRIGMIWQYARCRFGSYDGKPDFEANGESLHTEYWDCGFRCECPYEGRLCSTMKVANGVLTPREIDIVRLIADDWANKEIAGKLKISETTVPVHIQNIFEKIGGVKRRGSIIRFALDHNVVHLKKAL